MKLKCIGSGSSGNCYILTCNNEKLILDCGLPIKVIKQGLDFDLQGIQGILCTHKHLDHSLSVDDFKKMGFLVFKPYKDKKPMTLGVFKVCAIPMTNLQGKWMHTNADGSECPCYGFLITHPDMGRLLYITDTELVKWRFKDINHILISCNYQKKYIECDGAKRNHVLRGHMELETVKEFIKTNASDNLQNVILCHLSRDNADADEMVAEVKSIVPQANVCVAERGLEVELRNKNECPF